MTAIPSGSALVATRSTAAAAVTTATATVTAGLTALVAVVFALVAGADQDLPRGGVDVLLGTPDHEHLVVGVGAHGALQSLPLRRPEPVVADVAADQERTVDGIHLAW